MVTVACCAKTVKGEKEKKITAHRLIQGLSVCALLNHVCRGVTDMGN